MSKKLPVTFRLATPDDELTKEDLMNVNHPVNSKSLTGKRQGIAVLIGHDLYMATGSAPNDAWEHINEFPKHATNSQDGIMRFSTPAELEGYATGSATTPADVDVMIHKHSASSEHTSSSGVGRGQDWYIKLPEGKSVRQIRAITVFTDDAAMHGMITQTVAIPWKFPAWDTRAKNPVSIVMEWKNVQSGTQDLMHEKVIVSMLTMESDDTIRLAVRAVKYRDAGTIPWFDGNYLIKHMRIFYEHETTK